MVSGEARVIEVEVAYALPDRQTLVRLSVPQGCTALEAVRRSGVLEQFPEIDIDTADLGVFSKPLDGIHLPLARDYILRERDRVEIYRPLLVDPKTSRMQRALKARRGRGK